MSVNELSLFLKDQLVASLMAKAAKGDHIIGILTANALIGDMMQVKLCPFPISACPTYLGDVAQFEYMPMNTTLQVILIASIANFAGFVSQFVRDIHVLYSFLCGLLMPYLYHGLSAIEGKYD